MLFCARAQMLAMVAVMLAVVGASAWATAVDLEEGATVVARKATAAVMVGQRAALRLTVQAAGR